MDLDNHGRVYTRAGGSPYRRMTMMVKQEGMLMSVKREEAAHFRRDETVSYGGGGARVLP